MADDGGWRILRSAVMVGEDTGPRVMGQRGRVSACAGGRAWWCRIQYDDDGGRMWRGEEGAGQQGGWTCSSEPSRRPRADARGETRTEVKKRDRKKTTTTKRRQGRSVADAGAAGADE